MIREHTLEGLEPDNLLAVLALLGFLRAIDTVKPEWRIRAYWSGEPLRPRIQTRDEDVDQERLLGVAAEGCNKLAEVHEFDGRKDPDYSVAEARVLLETESRSADSRDRRRIDLLSALISDGAAKEDRVKVTPFCAMFGQGHQHFLERLETVPKGLPPKELAKEKIPPELNSPAMLAAALFQSWERKDRTQSFRWDPQEDRRYALRFEDPSSDKGLTVHGANRLGALALPLLTSVPVRMRAEIRLSAVATGWLANGGLAVTWPIWTRAASLKAIVSLLAGGVTPGFGILGTYQSERISVGKYFSFTRATYLP